MTFTVHDVGPLDPTMRKLKVPAVATFAVATGTAPDVTTHPPPKVMLEGPLTAIVPEAGFVVVAVMVDVGQLTASEPTVNLALDDVALTFRPGGPNVAALALPVSAANPTMAAINESASLEADVIRYAFLRRNVYIY